MIQYPCFISDSRTCQASTPEDIVFIIGSGSSEFKEDVEAIKETLDGFGLAGYFALLSDEEKGLDAFCDKICSKIRVSQFCVVMLNDPSIQCGNEKSQAKSDSIQVPSANVYYEFGIAVALGKPIIPIVRKGFRLPFDIQHLDAIIYTDKLDLKKKLKPSIRSTLTKKKKEFKVSGSKIIDVIYGPLYNEISNFLSKKDRFTKFNPSKYQGIKNQYKYLLDTIGKELQEETNSFYIKIEELNTRINRAKRIIQEIVAKQISDFYSLSYDKNLTIHVNLETDVGGTLPTLSQILIRKTTPKHYFETQRAVRRIRNITYTLEHPDHVRKQIDEKEFRMIFDKCRETVESNVDIVGMRALEEQLRIDGEELKTKLLQLCKQ